jgi:HK97 family phage major capsid protein/HK97 family phage prohead protease
MTTAIKPTPEEAKTRTAAIIADAQWKAEQTREFTVERAGIDSEKRTVALSFASDEPVERWFGQEILDCRKDAVNLKRLRNGGALLMDHDSRDQIGVVESCKVDETDGKCRAVVRFSKSTRAQEIFQDVIDGIRSLVSVGYRVKNMVLEAQDEESGDTYRVTEWEPHEISLVSIPADSTVGVGRSKSPAVVSASTTRTQMPPEAAAPAAPAQAAPVEVTRNAPPPVPDSFRMSEITAIGANFKVPQERINAALALNESLESFRAFVLEKIVKASPVTQSPEIGMSRAEKRRYSLQRAINRLAERQPLDGLELEASEAAAKQYKRETPAAGFLVPHDVAGFNDRAMMQAMFRVNPGLRMSQYGQQMERTLAAGVFQGAGALVPEEFLGGSFIEILRNRMLLTQLGVGTLSGLVGNVAIPRQSGAATAYWLAEGDSVTASDQAFAQVAATPRRLSAQTAFTKQLLAQAGLDAEALIRDDLMQVIAIAKDLAGIAGTGNAQPRGILNGPTTDGSGSSTLNQLQTVTFGGAPTWTNVVAFEQKIQTQNADISTMQFLTNPTVRSAWKTTVKVANYPVFLCENNRSNDYPVNITNQVGTSGTYANRVVFGAWSQAMFCDWAGMDVVVDPYTQAASNKIVVTVNQFTDFIVRHWPSFCVSTDSGAQ